MKTNLLLAVATFMFYNAVCAQAQLTIIGGPHCETTYLKKKNIYDAIDKIKPDLILIELDSSLLEKDFDIPKSLLESSDLAVIDSFIRKNPKTLLRPFDIEGRNKFFIENLYFENQSAFFGKLNRLYNTDSLTQENRLINEAMINLNKLADGFLFGSKLEVINSAQVDAIVKAKMNWYYNHFHNIVNTTPQLSKFSNYFRLDSVFWDSRNKAMAKHILHFISQYPDKKIVVITGNYHRYYLKELLLPEEKKYAFKLKEFYEQ